jgi:hypothetical protein
MLDAISQKLGLAGLAVKERAPELYLAAGIGAGVASVVMVAKAHKKSDEVFEEVRQDIDNVQTHVDSTNDEPTMTDIPPSEERKMLAPLYVRMVRQGAVLYGPGILMGVTAVSFILASHKVMKGRNRALAGALTLFQQGFSEYRRRVVEELGGEADERFYYGADARTVTTLEKDEDGKSKKKKGTENHIPENPTPIIYQRVFDATNPYWKPDRDMNEYFLRSVQQQMEDYLYLNGHVMLNTVYKALGYEDSPEGAVVGWSKNVPGDDFVRFGLDNPINLHPGDNRWFLDFNVNGVVFEHIGDR